MIARCVIGVAMAIPMFVVACGDSSSVRFSNRTRDKSDANFSRRDTTRLLGPGDIRIMNDDSTFELAMIGDSVATGLGTKVLDKVRDKTDTGAVAGNGFGANIEKFVKTTVADAMSNQVKYSVANISDVRYEGGKLQFFWKDGSRMRVFEDSHERGKTVSETFRPEDAQRFVAAFKARKAGRG